MTDADTNPDELREAAQEYLDAHTVWDGIQDIEPPTDEDTGNPFDTVAWLRWHREKSNPASLRLRAARTRLTAATRRPGDPTEMPTHPLVLVPYCRDVLGLELTEDQARWLKANPTR